MSFIINFPFISIVMSLLSAALCAVLGHRAARRLSFVSNLIAIGLSTSTLLYTTYTGLSYTFRMGHFDAPWGNEIRFGSLETFLAAVFCTVLLLSVRGGMKHLYDDNDENKLHYYFSLICLMQSAILSLVYTNDIFTGYVFIEICTLSSAGLLMIRQVGRTTVAAVRYMIFNLLGSGLFLIGVILLYDITGHLLMPNMANAVSELAATGSYSIPLVVSIAFMLLGLAIKSGLFPFYYWMPDTYGYATTASSSIISGVVSKAYIFIAIKIIYRVIGIDVIKSTHILDVIFIFGLCGIITGSLRAIKENNLNRMIAFSSAAQIGYIYVGIGLGSEAGAIAAVFHMLTHALTKPMLFTSADGLIDATDNKKDFASLKGAGHRNKIAGFGFSVGALSMVGLPIFAGFVSKLLFATAAVNVQGKVLVTLIVLAISTILNTIYFLRTVITIFSPAEISCNIKMSFRSQLSFSVVLILFSVLNIYLGLHPQPIIDIITKGFSVFT